MLEEMWRPVFKTSSLAILMAGICFGQSSIEILLPPGVSSENFFVRYLANGGGIGGWIQPRPNVSSYTISTHSAARIRALLYSPGCAIQTFDLALADKGDQQYSFICQTLPTVEMSGELARSDRLYERKVQLQARYVARWAQSFLGLDDEIGTFIPIGEPADISSSGEFHLSLPDLSRDALAGSPDHPGELQIWARDAASGRIAAQLIPDASKLKPTRMGGLPIQNPYPLKIVFTTCAANNPEVRDALGFTLRPGPYDNCDR
jgi:hypothetical protein